MALFPFGPGSRLAHLVQTGGWGRERLGSSRNPPNYVKRIFRLKSRVDFQNVYTKGKSVANRVAVLYVLPARSSEAARIGLAAGRKLGKAVVRNRVKRRLKEAVRLLWPRVRPGLSLVVIGRQASKEMAFSHLCARVQELFERAGVLRAEG